MGPLLKILKSFIRQSQFEITASLMVGMSFIGLGRRLFQDKLKRKEKLESISYITCSLGNYQCIHELIHIFFDLL